MIHYKDAGASSAFMNPLKTEYSMSINPPVVTTGRINDKCQCKASGLIRTSCPKRWSERKLRHHIRCWRQA
eukprot:scaffold3312_cov225-Alexandrium_tamarense.AAC.3